MTVTVDDDADQDTLVAAVNELYERVERLEDENQRLRDELAEERERSARERADVRSDVHELTEAVESHEDAETEASTTVSSEENPEGQTGEDGEDRPTETVPSPKTALEDTLRLPESVASDSLTANEQRARSVARDIGDYAEYNHQYGNYSLTAKRLRIVLKAQSDDEGAAHHQTVKRVRRFLNRLGESEVSVVEDRGGTKRLVFAESLVERIEAWVDTHVGVRDDTVGAGIET